MHAGKDGKVGYVPNDALAGARRQLDAQTLRRSRCPREPCKHRNYEKIEALLADSDGPVAGKIETLELQKIVDEHAEGERHRTALKTPESGSYAGSAKAG